jgi:hypothetical protein
VAKVNYAALTRGLAIASRGRVIRQGTRLKAVLAVRSMRISAYNPRPCLDHTPLANPNGNH